MLSVTDYIRHSLELHLFFARIMKEHAFFLQISFSRKSSRLIHRAQVFQKEFEILLGEIISLSDGLISPEVFRSGELVTPYTLRAERAAEYFTGVDILTGITEAVAVLSEGPLKTTDHMLEHRVFLINQRAMNLIRDFTQFKAMVLDDVNACRITTAIYPSMLEHILHEAKHYYNMVREIQSAAEKDLEKEAFESEAFWNHIMGDHSKFIRGLLDPSEDELIKMANDFADEFEKLTHDVNEAMNKNMPLDEITDESIKATSELDEFKKEGTKGILECKIKSLINPLLSDHVLREGYHYLRLLKTYKQ